MIAAEIAPGPRDSLTDVEGLRVGQATDLRVRTGVSVVLCDRPAVAAVDVRGGAPGTVETDALHPTGLVSGVDAVVLSGGSAFGLDAASAVKSRLAARGVGFRVGPATVPIVPGAILFDLANGGAKDWGENPPYRSLALTALDAAGLDVTMGNVGAGTGAVAGRLKGGTGTASLLDPLTGITVAALVAVNAFGSVTMPASTCFWAWWLERDGEWGGMRPPPGAVPLDPETKLATQSQNTTIGVVATDAVLDKPQAMRLAIMAQDGYARAIRPIHTPFDGDALFALATGRKALSDRRDALLRLGTLAADCVARAICRGVHAAVDLGEHRAWRSVAAR